MTAEREHDRAADQPGHRRGHLHRLCDRGSAVARRADRRCRDERRPRAVPLMPLEPDFETFRARYEAGENQVVWTRLAADLDTPVSLMLKLSGAGRHAFVLESVTGGEVRGRYSIVGMNPDLVWECRGTTSRINRAARYDDDAWQDCEGDPLTALRALLAESRIDLPEGLPAASAGLFGYLGYDMIRLVERLPNVTPDPIGLPDAVLLRPSVVAVLDGVKGDVILVAPAWAGAGQSARAAYAQAAERVTDAQRRPGPPGPRRRPDPGRAAPRGAAGLELHASEGYKAAVETAKDYIRAGDIFQVVPSQRWSQGFHAPPFALYRSLRRTNPSPFMFFFNFGALPGDRRVSRDPGARVRPRGDGPADRRHPAARRHAGRGQQARGRPPGRQQGARRASDAARPRPQRCRPRRPDRQRAAHRAVRGRALQPRDAHRLERGRRARPGARRAFGPPRRPARRHRLGRAQGARDGDHRRARAGKARRLWRRRRLLLGAAATWTCASRSAPPS